MALVEYHFQLDALRDRELIVFLESQPCKEAVIREALLLYLNRHPLQTLSDKVDALLEVVRKKQLSLPEPIILELESDSESENNLALMLEQFKRD